MKLFLALFLFISNCTFSQSLPANYPSLIKDVTPKVVEWRRHFHQNPELSNREVNTRNYISQYLTSLGLEVKSHVANNGVVAILKGGKPGPVIALRADIDALPLTEKNSLPFASKVTTTFGGTNVGVMHACGHDSHTAMLMGTATVLKQMQKDVPGTIVFLFQPAEEGAPDNEEGGAALMIKQGALDNPKVDAVFGFHIESNIPVGEIRYKSGSFMASSDWFTINIKGKGAHGSTPWKGVDPIATATQIISGLQQIVSRQMDLSIAPVVITVGTIQSGVRPNILPAECNLTGTIRTLDSKMQEDVHERIRNTVKYIAQSTGASASVSIDKKTLVTYNDPELVRRSISSLEKAAGSGNVKITNWDMNAEDFSFYGQKAPSFFFYLGGMPKGQDPKTAPSHHTSEFFIDESGFDLGIKTFCQLIFDYNNKS